ncbi:MAG TPA: hypothetical protein VNC60_06360 [Actinomycetota bacterium]|nr:hypothetical protein [Actinomycetota bacterium]
MLLTTTVAMLASGCGRDAPAAGPETVAPAVPVEIDVSATATIDPQAESGFASGSASVTLTGTLNVSETYPALGLPAWWEPPPADFAMTWIAAGDRSMSLGGGSFSAQQPTSPTRVLTFSVAGIDGPVEFRSENGECLVTISPALPDRMGGTFLCAAVTGAVADGSTVTAAAQGTFTAE